MSLVKGVLSSFNATTYLSACPYISGIRGLHVNLLVCVFSRMDLMLYLLNNFTFFGRASTYWYDLILIFKVILLPVETVLR